MLTLRILLLLLFPAALAANSFSSLCYHEVHPINQGDLHPDQYAISSENLRRHFDYIQGNGFNPISIDQLLAAQQGKTTLPEKAVLLTFDDGYSSFYSEVYPLLKRYDYPAVLALVGSWLETPADQPVLYGDKEKQRSEFLSWNQIREMQSSGLVEIASHSYNLHRGIYANPQGNSQPAAVTRQYFPEFKNYETDEAYQQRILDDLKTNSELLARKTGNAPRVMVWPYGAFSQETIMLAKKAGMPINLTLQDTQGNSSQNLIRIDRMLITANPDEGHLAWMLNRKPEAKPTRVVHVDLDYVYDDDLGQQQKNLDILIERIKRYQINTVYLQAFADPDGDGNADALYFPNRHLPMRRDLFNHAAWQLRNRSGVSVYAWMPVLAYQLADDIYPEHGVKHLSIDAGEENTPDYLRLSPFSATARQVIREIYEDLGKNTKISGVLFHDDAYLTDYEDFSEAAISYYNAKGIKASPTEIIGNPVLRQSLGKLKTEVLINFTLTLADTLSYYQPDIKTARNIYAMPVLNPDSEEWFAQNLKRFVEVYDMTAIMAMPFMEQASDPHMWLAELLDMVKKSIPEFDPTKPDAASLDKVLFELQAQDWNNKSPVDPQVLQGQMRYLLENGIDDLGYYPDDFIHNSPPLDKIRPVFSLSTFPYDL